MKIYQFRSLECPRVVSMHLVAPNRESLLKEVPLFHRLHINPRQTEDDAENRSSLRRASTLAPAFLPSF